MRVQVNVTKDDIKLGERCSTTDDAVARAVGRALREVPCSPWSDGSWPPVSVNGDGVYVGTDHQAELLATLPWWVCEWIANFDDGGSVEPITFELELVG